MPAMPAKLSTASAKTAKSARSTASAALERPASSRATASAKLAPPGTRTAPRPVSTTHRVSTLGRAALSCATVAARSMPRPPYQTPSTAIRALGVTCRSRSSTAGAPMSGEQRVQIAPRLAQARRPITASGMLGR